MALFSSYGSSESPYVRVGDSAFIGMDYRTAPDKLPKGVYSYGENVRTRTKEVVTRPGNPYIGWFYPDNYPWDLEYPNGGVALTGTFDAGPFLASSTGLDGDVTVDSGTTSGSPYGDGNIGFDYTHLRFGSGSGPALVLKATGEESGGVIPVETTPIANIQSVTAEQFVWCKEVVGDENTYQDMTRSVITNASPTQTILTTGSFRDPDSHDYAVVVTDTSTWFGREYNRPFEVTVPNGIDDTAYLLQCFNKLILFRGTGQTPLEYSSATNAWNSITASSAAGYTLPIPNAERAVFFQNRVWVHVSDRLYFSDIGEYTRYYWLDNEVRINEGDNDDIVALFPFGKYAMLVFKENSIFALDNLYGDVAANMRVRQISNKIGCGAAETITNVGNRVWFCDKAGDVWDISQVDEERMELSGEPVSWPIKPFIDEKGARNVSTWVGAYHDSYFYLFIDTDYTTWTSSLWNPIPNYSNLNRVAVYDTINEAWVSLDWDISLNAIGKPMYLDYLGKQRLMLVDKATGNLRVIGYGEHDGTRKSVETGLYRHALVSGDPYAEFVTRGYTAELGTEQSFSQVRVQVARYDNNMSVTGIVDGVNETEEFINENTSLANRTDYLNHNESVGYDGWDATNVNSDWGNPYRKDYSIYPSAGSGGISLTSLGLPTDQFQNYKFVQKINELGNFMQLKIIADGGRFKVKDAAVEIRSNMNLQGERV